MRLLHKLRKYFSPSGRKGKDKPKLGKAVSCGTACGYPKDDLQETPSLAVIPDGPVCEAEERAKKLPQYNRRSIKAKYRMGEAIGEGGFSTVRKVTDRATGEELACKIIRFSKQEGDEYYECMSREAIFNEIELASRTNCKSISCVKEFFCTKSKVYVVQSLLQGGILSEDLLDRAGQKYSEEESKCIFKQLLSGLKYLHSKNVVHRDLKLQNLMLENPGDLSCIKIIDFGLAKHTISLTNTVCGSPLYVAPEVLSRSSLGHGHPVDMWSAGVILYCLMSGNPPFYAEQEMDLYEIIQNCKYNFKDPIWNSISDSAKDLISRCLVLDPETRLTASEALNHPWFDEVNEQEVNN